MVPRQFKKRSRPRPQLWLASALHARIGSRVAGVEVEEIGDLFVPTTYSDTSHALSGLDRECRMLNELVARSLEKMLALHRLRILADLG